MKLLTIAAVALLACSGAVRSAKAQHSIFLQTDPEIKGEATATGFVGAWQVLSFSLGITNPGGATSKPSFQDVSVTKFLDRASVRALLGAAQGTTLDKVTISFVRDSTGEIIYQILLEDVSISSMSQSGAAGADKPSESLTLAFAKVTWKYGDIEASYDLTQ